MSSTQFPPVTTGYPLSFHNPAASCLSFSHSPPLFSITSSLPAGILAGLSCQKQEGGYRFFTPLFSSTSELLFSQLLSFHNHLRCPLVFRCADQTSTPDALSPFPLITSLQPKRFHAITHSFAQRRQAIPPILNRFRTLSIATGVYESAWQLLSFVRARLQPCRKPSQINKASAAEGVTFEFSHRLVSPPTVGNLGNRCQPDFVPEQGFEPSDVPTIPDPKEVTETTQNRSLQQTPKALYTFQPIEY
jgi:hypothetical protein